VVSKIDTSHEQLMREEAQRTGREMTRVVGDLAQGRPPSTESLTSAIDRADKILLREEQTNPILQSDDKARQTIHDTHEFLEASKNLLVHKTGDNKLQSFLVNSLQASSELASKSSGMLSGATGAAGSETEEMKQMRQHFLTYVEHSRKVLIELSTSREFRDFITRSADIISRLLGMPVSFGQGLSQVKEQVQGGQTQTQQAQGVEDSGAHLRATAAQTKRLAEEESQQRSRTMEWMEESEEGLVYEETDYEVSAARLGSMDLPHDYSALQGTMDPASQTFVTAGDARSEHYITPGRGPLADTHVPKLKVVEKVYMPGQRVPGAPGSVGAEQSRTERLSSSVQEKSTTASTSSMSSESSEASRTKSAPMESASGLMSAVQQMWLENVDKEERKRIQADFFALLSKMSAHPDHKQAVESLFALAGIIWKSTPSANSLGAMPPTLRQATADGKTLLGAFAGGEKNIDNLIYHLQAFAQKVQNDPEVERILRKFGKYFIRGLDDPSLIQQAFFRQKIYNLLDRAGFLGERYANDNDLREALQTWKLIVTNISNDQDINAFGKALLKLRDDVSYIDNTGARRVDFGTLSRLRGVILPMLVEQLHYIPLPAISGDTPDMAYRMEDMVISFYDVLPEHIFIDTETHTDLKPMSDYEHEYIDKTLEAGHLFHDEGELGTRKAYNRHHAWGYFKGRRAKAKHSAIRPREKIAPHLTADKKTATYGSSVALDPNLHHRSTAQMVIRAYNIQFAIKNMKFDVLRKKFPKVHAKGLADVHTQGSKGSKIIIRLDMAMDAYQATPFTGAAVAVKIAPLKVKIHNSKHDMFYTTMSNMFGGTIRKRAEAAIVERMQGSVKTLLETLNGTFASTIGQLPGFRIAKPSLTSTASAVAGQATSTASKVASAVAPTKVIAQQ